MANNMKKLGLAFILLVLAGCGNSKHDIYDKCLNQTNQTISKEDKIEQRRFMDGCMRGYGYFNGLWDFKELPNSEPPTDCYKHEMSFNCYIKK